MSNKDLFMAFCEKYDIDVQYLTYEDLVNEEGEDGIEDFTGKCVGSEQAVYWFSDMEPLFYLVNQFEDISQQDIDYMLLYCSNSLAFDEKDVFEEYEKFVKSH